MTCDHNLVFLLLMNYFDNSSQWWLEIKWLICNILEIGNIRGSNKLYASLRHKYHSIVLV